MDVIRDIPSVRRAVRAARERGRRIGLVPTMGALHVAHLSLVEAARRSGNYVAVSIFVNPTQFGPGEDYEAYPRAEKHDLETCRNADVDLVFLPSAELMHAPDAATVVRVEHLTETLCGPCRPGHFQGVATVVAKLFNIVQPDAAYFGEKDAQQLAVIRRMARDLNLPVEIVGCPTVREPGGLAVSSRNAHLSEQERAQARCLYAALCDARARIQAGQSDPALVTAAMRRIVEQAGPAAVDYIDVVDPESMHPPARIDRPVLVALALRIGTTRLIDNMTIDPRAAGG